MNPLQAFLHLLADPNIAFILFTLGFYGPALRAPEPELRDRASWAPSRIILAFIGFGSLPLNIAGLLLIGLAIVLFVLELTVTSHGLLAIGGLVAFVLGASALYTEPGTPTAPDVSRSRCPIIVVMTAIAAAFLALVVCAALRTRRMPPVNVGVAQRRRAPGPRRARTREVRRALAADRDGLCCGRGVDRPERGRPQPRARHAGAHRGPGRPDADRRTRVPARDLQEATRVRRP